MIVDKYNKHDWIAAVSDWFEKRKALFAFLDIKDLKSQTVQMMVKFEAEVVTQVMDQCAGCTNVQVTGKSFGISQFKIVVQDMPEFNTRVYDMLNLI